MKLILPFYVYHERWALYVVIKQKVFLHLYLQLFYHILCYDYQ